ncbi:MAG: NUDIX domain-containing protein [Myxococcales bacterium]|nr:NUDIX domain-containing protein [Myxococcota bacterium]MDW8280061.1 NUDIX domain-containing protein [Myxococcales bacterium]
MAAQPKLIRVPEAVPDPFAASLFLAGPEAPGRTWRDEAVALLGAGGFDGVIFIPTGEGALDSRTQARWEREALRHADAVLFWLPEGIGEMDLALGEQWGTWRRSGKVVLGAPQAVRQRIPHWFEGPPRVPTASTLPDAVKLLWPLLRPGALRSGGERAVPLHLWRSPSFHRWYRALRAAGNVLDDIEVEWSYRLRAPTGRPPIVWALRPRIWVRRERRHKAGEVVVGRSDVSATVLYVPAASLEDTVVVLVREFRSAALNPTGMVWELPGGSAEHAADRDQDPRDTAVREVQQETGLVLDRDQLEPVPPGARQVAATILTHRAHLFRAALTPEQIRYLEQLEQEGRPHGANPGERCYVALRTVRQILDGGELDWGQVGMILTALLDRPRSSAR